MYELCLSLLATEVGLRFYILMLDVLAMEPLNLLTLYRVTEPAAKPVGLIV